MKLSVLILNKETDEIEFRKEGSDIATMNSKIVITIIAHPNLLCLCILYIYI